MGEDRTPDGAGKLREHRTDLRVAHRAEGGEAGAQQVGEGPAADHAVERGDQQRAEDGKDPDQGPAGAGRQLAHRADGALARLPPDQRFTVENRQGEKQGADDVDDDERGTAVLAHHVGEAPDVAQPDRRTGEGEDGHQIASEDFSVGFHNLLLYTTNSYSSPVPSSRRVGEAASTSHRLLSISGKKTSASATTVWTCVM